jgi:hypothetical protein
MDIDPPERASNNLQVMMLIKNSWMRDRELTATVLGSGRNLFVMDISAMLYATLDEQTYCRRFTLYCNMIRFAVL